VTRDLPYVPDFAVPHRVVMGLESVPDSEPWLEIDDEWGSDVGEKRRLLEEHGEQVSVALPESLPAQRETLDVVIRALERHPDRALVPSAGQSPSGKQERPLDEAALQVQEDLCLLERADAWRLTAANVCFPTRWDLLSKLGLPLDEIHGRVPHYREDLARPADRFFDGMKPGRVFRRSNWSLVDDPALFQPGGKFRRVRNQTIDAESAGDLVWIRSEIQTLQRLPTTDAVLFTIRVYRTPLGVLGREPERARALAGSLRSMSEPFLLYKSFPAIGDAVLGYLDRVAGVP
jgi:hypothetical protein